MSMTQRRRVSAWVVGALLIVALFAGVREAGPEVAVSVVGREAALKLWLYDSTGNRLTDIDDGVVFLYLSQTDSIGSTYYATYMASETTWVAAVPDTGDIYTVAYASSFHAYVLIDSLAIGGKLVPKASIYPAAFQASSVPESALTIDTVCPRHMDTDSTFVLTLDTTSVVPAQALPSDILYESEFDAWFTAMLADSLPAWLLGEDYGAAFSKLAVDSIGPNDSTAIYINQGAYVLPIADGALNNVLKTDGAGTVSWAADATGAGGSAYAESLETADGRFGADTWLNATGEIDTTTIHVAGWEKFVQDHQSAVPPGAGTMHTVEENDVILDATVDTLDFLGADFDITEAPENEANIAIAAAITRDSEWDSASEINAATTDADFLTAEVGDIEGVTAGEGLTGTASSGTATLAVNLDVAGGLESVDDSLNVKLNGGTMTVGTSGLAVDSTSVMASRWYANAAVVAYCELLIVPAFDNYVLCTAVDDSVHAYAYYPGGTDVADADVVDALTLSTVSGAVDMGAATSLEVPNDANPTTNAEGEVAWDSNDDALEVYSGDESESALIPIYQKLDVTIFAPDEVNDAIPIFHVDALLYPFGIEIDQVSITIPSDGAYTMVFEEWAADPPAAQADIETVTTGAGDSYMEDGTITNDAVDADDYIFLHVPATDIDWIHCQLVFHVKEGN